VPNRRPGSKPHDQGVNYLLLPFWLIAAAIIIARRQGSASRSGESLPMTTIAAQSSR